MGPARHRGREDPSPSAPATSGPRGPAAGILSGMDERTSRLGSALRPLLSGWAPVVGWAALMFILSSQPNLRFVPDAGLDVVVRKLGHMGVFGILVLLLWRALAGTTAWRRAWV